MGLIPAPDNQDNCFHASLLSRVLSTKTLLTQKLNEAPNLLARQLAKIVFTFK